MSHHTSIITRPRPRSGNRGTTRAPSTTGHDLTTMVAAARNGCPTAEAALYDHHRPMVTAVARRHGLDEHQCADVVQRAWLKARQNLPGLRRDDRFGPWLAAIARNESVSVIRSTAKEVGLPRPGSGRRRARRSRPAARAGRGAWPAPGCGGPPRPERPGTGPPAVRGEPGLPAGRRRPRQADGQHRTDEGSDVCGDFAASSRPTISSLSWRPECQLRSS